MMWSAGSTTWRNLYLEPGQSLQAPVSDGKKAVVAKIEAQQREEIKVPDGTYKTIRYEIFLFDNVLYRRSGHLYAWPRTTPEDCRCRFARAWRSRWERSLSFWRSTNKRSSRY